MIGILTFYWADDYGGMLQAYALKHRLELMGERAEMVPYAPIKLRGRYWLCPLCAERKDGGLRYFFHRYMFQENLRQGWSFWVRRWAMGRFRRKYLTERRPARNVRNLLAPYRTVLVGSDQVWNPDITVDLDDAYIGNIPRREDCRLVAYGASLGGKRLLEGDREKFVRHVKEFAAISLRERTDADYVEELLGRRVRDVLDPVLLLDAAEWRRAAKPPRERGYILLYLTEYHEPLLRCAQALSKELGRELLSLSRPSTLAGGCAPPVQTRSAGPAEFLGYLEHADCVLTNSFHGTAFSILLEKAFLAFRHSTRNNRLEDLLNKLGLSSHMMEEAQPEEALKRWAETDWEEVRRRLAEERERSLRFLAESL